MHPQILSSNRYRNVLSMDYVKRPRRSVTAKINRVKNTEWQCLAVAEIKAPNRCMAWSGRYGQELRNGGFEIVKPVKKGIKHIPR